jgi:hypothetical protein
MRMAGPLVASVAPAVRGNSGGIALPFRLPLQSDQLCRLGHGRACHDFLRKLLRGGRIDALNQSLYARDQARRNGKVANSHADKHGNQFFGAGHVPAHGDRFAAFVSRFHHRLYRPEDGRMPGRVPVRHLIVGAVDGQHVLDEIVGADG